jgi:hypothetical protein
MDFVADQLHNGSKLRLLTIVDTYYARMFGGGARRSIK